MRGIGAHVSEKAVVGDVKYRAFVLMRAIVASPEEIASMCRGAMRLSQDARDRIVRRIEREEQQRLSGKRQSRRRLRTQSRGAVGTT